MWSQSHVELPTRSLQCHCRGGGDNIVLENRSIVNYSPPPPRRMPLFTRIGHFGRITPPPPPHLSTEEEEETMEGGVGSSTWDWLQSPPPPRIQASSSSE